MRKTRLLPVVAQQGKAHETHLMTGANLRNYFRIMKNFGSYFHFLPVLRLTTSDTALYIPGAATTRGTARKYK